MGREWNVYVFRLGKLHGAKPCRYVPKGRSRFWVVGGNCKLRVDVRYRKGMCVTAQVMTDLGATPGPLVREWRWPSMKKKQTGSVDGASSKHLAALETDVFRELIPLVEHCAVRQYDDGSPREPGWFTVKTLGAAWVVQIKDPDSALTFSMVAQSLDKALEDACVLLACDEAPWEPDNFLAAARAKKNKK